MTEASKTPVIVVCIDTSNASEIVLRYACYKARLGKFAVQILSVVEASHKNLLFGAKAIENEKRQELENSLRKLVDRVCGETGIMPSISIREGDITTEITRELKFTPNCVMLILGKSSNSLSDNTVLPKVAKKIGNKIQVPVVIVPQNLDDEFLKKLL
jgi:K+-sensing histidine kinase KdpD